MSLYRSCCNDGPEQGAASLAVIETVLMSHGPGFAIRHRRQYTVWLQVCPLACTHVSSLTPRQCVFVSYQPLTEVSLPCASLGVTWVPMLLGVLLQVAMDLHDLNFMDSNVLVQYTR